MITNLTRQTTVARTPVSATTFFPRLRGMIGRRFAGFDAMVFPRCDGVHTCFMGIDLDLVYVDRDGQVCAICAGLRPWRMHRAAGAATVIELPAGALAASGTQPGDRLDLGPAATT